MSEKDGCCQGDMCKKTPGLTILLARYAVAIKESKAYKLAGRFDKMKQSFPLGNHAYYSLRSLRPGYVYTYNPEDKDARWRGYIVTPKGFLYGFPEPIDDDKGPAPITLNSTPDPCVPNGANGASARCITIPMAGQAKEVWVVYSEVEWTKKIWKSFDGDSAEAKERRDKVMTRINVQNWMNTKNPTADNAELAKTGLKKIADLTGEDFEVGTFDFSINPPEPECVHYDFDSAFKSLGTPQTRGKAMVLALEDPAGIAADLQAMMNYRHDEALREQATIEGSLEVFQRKHAVASAIETMSNTMMAGKAQTLEAYYHAHLDRIPIYRGLRTASEPRRGVPDSATGVFLGHMKRVGDEARNRARAGNVPPPQVEGIVEEAMHKELEKIEEGLLSVRAEIEEQVKKESKEAWEPYKEFYDSDGVKNFQDACKEKLEEANEKYIADLDGALAKWLESDTLYNYYVSCFDNADADCGVVYSISLSKCLGASQDKVACYEVIKKWVAGKVTDERNLYLRSVILNQSDVATALSKYATLGRPKVNLEDVAEGTTREKLHAVLKKLEPYEAQLMGLNSVLHNRIARAARESVDVALSMLINQGMGAMVARMSGLGVDNPGMMTHLEGVLSAHTGRPIALATCEATPGGMYATTENLVLRQLARNGAVRNIEIPGGLGAYVYQLPGRRETRFLAAIDTNFIQQRLNSPGYFTDSRGRRLAGSALSVRHGRTFRNSQIDLTRIYQNQHPGAMFGTGGQFAGLAFAKTVSGIGNVLSAVGALDAYRQFITMYRASSANQRGLEVLGGRLLSYVLSLGGSISAFFAGMIQRFAAPALRAAQASIWKFLHRAFAGAAASGGVAGGILMAVMDFVDGVKAIAKDKLGLGMLYFASTIVGGVTTYVIWYMTFSAAATAAKATGAAVLLWGMSPAVILVVLLVALAVVAYWLNKEEERDKLETWLDRTIFGKGVKKGEKAYQFHKEEQEGLKLLPQVKNLQAQTQ